jgi:AraC-like DNA-binding protein
MVFIWYFWDMHNVIAPFRINTALRGRSGPHWQWVSPVLPDYDIWIPAHGEGTIWDGSIPYPASRGMCFFLRKGTVYRAEQAKGVHMHTMGVHFDFIDANGASIEPQTLPPFQIRLSNPDFVIELAERTVDAWRADLPEKRDLQALQIWGQACVSEVLAQATSLLSPNVSRGQRIQLEHILRYEINNGYRPRFSVDQLARKVGYSRRQFCRLFKQHTALTPTEYMLRKRIADAKYLLQTTTLTSDQIAIELGYTDASHFTKQFH